MSAQDKQFQPKTVIWREVEYSHHLAQLLGVLDFDQNFDNNFQKMKLAMSLKDDVIANVANGNIPLEEKEMMNELYPDKKAMKRMDLIWNGTVYLRIVKNEQMTQVMKRELFYKRPDEYTVLTNNDGEQMEFRCEVIQMPKLKNLLPVGQLKDDTWGIQVREPMEFKYATQGSQYGTIIEEGRFKWMTPQGMVPKIEPEDLEGFGKLTYVYSRPVYFELIDILTTFFDKNYQVFAGDVQKIMKWMTEESHQRAKGGYYTEESDRPKKTFIR